MSRYYAGIGSRETPEDVLDVMDSIADKLARNDYIVRTGGAPGADTAFAQGARFHGADKAEIYLPWAGFEDWPSTEVVRTAPQTPQAFEIAAKYHPAWKKLSRGARLLIARNSHQVLGHDLDNPIQSEFVVCWTKDAKGGGGTGQALRIAKDHGIPIHDLGDEKVLALFRALV